MVSLAAQWRSCGVKPSAVVGHSQGEIAAAYVAGGLSLRDAARIVAVRSQLVRDRLAGAGGMVSVALPVERAEELIAPYEGRVSVAAVNGPPPSSSPVNPRPRRHDGGLRARGDPRPPGQGRLRLPLPPGGGHLGRTPRSPLPVRPVSGNVPFYSTVTGDFIDTATMDATYWYTNLRGQVGFEPAIRALIDKGMGCFVEVSPHPVLTMAVEETVEARDAAGRVAVLGSCGATKADRTASCSPSARHTSPAYGSTGTRCTREPEPSASTCPPTPSSTRRTGSPLRTGRRRRRGRTRPHAAPGPGRRRPGRRPRRVGVHRALLHRRPALDTRPRRPRRGDRPRRRARRTRPRRRPAPGLRLLDELVLEAPLTLDEGTARHIRVTVGQPGEDGRREVAVHSSPTPRPDRTPSGRSSGTRTANSPPTPNPPPLPGHLAAGRRRRVLRRRPLRAAGRRRTRLRPAVPGRTGGVARGHRGVRRGGPARGDHHRRIRPPPGAVRLRTARQHARQGRRNRPRPAVLLVRRPARTARGQQAARPRQPRGRLRLPGRRRRRQRRHGPRRRQPRRTPRGPGTADPADGAQNTLFQLEWAPVTGTPSTARVVVLGDLDAPGERFADLPALEAALADRTVGADVVLAEIESPDTDDPPTRRTSSPNAPSPWPSAGWPASGWARPPSSRSPATPSPSARSPWTSPRHRRGACCAAPSPNTPAASSCSTPTATPSPTGAA
ncbi:acyltransferase domain-containing protein [Streptomyces sp. M19]